MDKGEEGGGKGKVLIVNYRAVMNGLEVARL